MPRYTTMMVGPKKVVVLLGTFNGRNFLEEQVESIFQQTFDQWVLLIRDDGSTDDTPKLLDQFRQGDPRIELLQDNLGRVGVVRNYGLLMEAAKERCPDVVFFADQDDVWMPHKLTTQIEMIRNLEQAHSSEIPILVYSDLSVVDENLQVIHPSFMRLQNLIHEPVAPLRTLLSQNLVTGCATAINRSLLTVAIPVPEVAVMHDWWLALCAGAFGVIGYTSEPLLFYRQHSNNQIGAPGWWNLFNVLSPTTRRRWRTHSLVFAKTFQQARALYTRAVEHPHPSPWKDLIFQYANCVQRNRMRRVLDMMGSGVNRQGIMRKLIFYMRLLLLRADGY